VYHAGPVDYLRFLCGIGTLPASGVTCQTYGSVAPWNLNLASLTAANVLGKITITRTVQNVGSAAATYTGSATAAGWTATLKPATLTLAPGGSASYDVTMTRTTAETGSYVFGNVVWTDGTHQVRSPLTLKASLFARPPAEISDTRKAGATPFKAGTGYNGTLRTTPSGMQAATLRTGQIGTNAKQCFNVTVPVGTQIARFQLFNSDTQGGSGSDLDLEVYNGAGGTGALVGSSRGGTSDELVDLRSPAASNYSACVIGYAPVGGLANYTLSSWVIGQPVGVQTLRAPGPMDVVLGGIATIAPSWNVGKGSRYLGILQFTDGGGTALGTTLVSVDARE